MGGSGGTGEKRRCWEGESRGRDGKASRSPGSRFGRGITFSVLRMDSRTLIREPSSPNARRQAVQLALVDNDGGEGIQTRSR